MQQDQEYGFSHDKIHAKADNKIGAYEEHGLGARYPEFVAESLGLLRMAEIPQVLPRSKRRTQAFYPGPLSCQSLRSL